MVVVTVMVDGPSDSEVLDEGEGSEVGLGADSDPDSEPVAAGRLELGPVEAVLEAPGTSPEADLEAPGTSPEADLEAPGASPEAEALVFGASEADFAVDSAADLEADLEAGSAPDLVADSPPDLVADSESDLEPDSAADVGADSSADLGADSAADFVTPSEALSPLSPALLVSAAALVTLVLSLPDHSLAPQTLLF